MTPPQPPTAALDPQGVMALPDPPGLSEALAYASSYLQFHRALDRIPGIQVAVWAAGQVQLSAAHGWADREAGDELTERHLFRIASHSKTVTATLILQLVEDGRLRLDDPAGQWMTELADSPTGSLTVRELLSHSSGLYRDSFDGDFWQLRQPFPDRTVLLTMLTDARSTVLPPNERFKYSNIAYGLLGLIIEAAAGSSFADLVALRIAEPLGLSYFGAEYDTSRSAEFAAGYSSLHYADKRSRIEHVHTAALAAATGVYSTAADLVRYFAAHCYGELDLLSDASKRVMQQAQWSTGTGTDRRYGLGLALTRVGKREMIGHGGGYPGHITCSLADPHVGLAVSVFTNAIDGPAQSLAHAVVKLIDLAAAKPRPDPGDVDPARFVGRYASLWGVVDVALLGGRLYRIHPATADPTEDAAELRIVDDRTLRTAGGDGYGAFGETLTFNFGTSGEVVGVRGDSQVSLVPLTDFVLPAVVTTDS